ncbi:hypothetical protein NQZ68_019796 [Xyrichtys novacula]|uniref:Uncharacterized protein n=1 Tax=Xyrichtys novacula TaxID=13765 RepID=A0AAV1G479_XYRNO|nr:hypothetical protein NQZ68_019796 [Xyrichtys novacula]
MCALMMRVCVCVCVCARAFLRYLFCLFLSPFPEDSKSSKVSLGLRHAETEMLYLLGTVVGLLFIIMFFSKGLKEASQSQKSQVSESSANKKDLTEEDVQLLARILSVGLVDADPNYLQHLKEFRDLRGG